jgi:hypothetical protein
MSMIRRLTSLDLKALGSLTLLVSRYPAYSASKTRLERTLHRVQLRFLG